MIKKLLLWILLPLAGGIFIFQFFVQKESKRLNPVDSVFTIQYQDRTENSLGTQQALLQGYLNYFAKLKLKVIELSDSDIQYQAILNITSLDSKPELLEPINEIPFVFTQKYSGLIESVSMREKVSDTEYSLVLNFLANVSHKLYNLNEQVVKQDLFDGESWAAYSTIPTLGSDRRVSFKYIDDKKWKVSGGGIIDLEDAFYSELSAKYKKTMTLYDKSRQTRSLQFSMVRSNDDELNADWDFNGDSLVVDSLKGELLLNRFKLEEMKNLIWAKDKLEIQNNFYVPDSDGQPWYEFMAYYYVHKDERDELTEAFKAHPEKRGEIVLALASIGDDEAQAQMLDIIETVSDKEKEDYIRYGIFLERPNENSIDTYQQYSGSNTTYARTAEKILASMYHKYSNTDKYDQEVDSLIDSLDDSTILDQRHRFSVLGNLGSDQVLSAVEGDLSSADEDIERLAIDALRFNEDDETKSVLKDKATSNNSAVRLSALESLRGDYFEGAYDFYESRMKVEGNKDNRIQLLKNIYDIRNTSDDYRQLIYQESRDCAYQEICVVANKMLEEY